MIKVVSKERDFFECHQTGILSDQNDKVQQDTLLPAWFFFFDFFLATLKLHHKNDHMQCIGSPPGLCLQRLIASKESTHSKEKVSRQKAIKIEGFGYFYDCFSSTKI